LLSAEQSTAYLEKITDREITTRIESKRLFSAHGILFILLAPLLPIAYTWLSPLAFSNESPARETLFTVEGFAISALGIASALVALLYVTFFSAVIFKYGSQRVDGLRAALSAGARMFSKDTDHDKITQSVRERNPTTEEFQKLFREILGQVQKKEDRVVFVFDNIDRLPSDVVSKVWSETRAIFSMRSRGAQPEHSSVMAIVPYDAAYVSEVFEEESSAQSNRAEHLIKKTFDLSLRVAPPLSTDWRAFLDKKLDAAFPAPLSEEEKYKVFKLFDIEQQERGVFPTPRNIIAYVNDVAAIWNQWGDRIPVPHIALYVLQRRHLERNAGTIKTSASTNQRLVRVVGGENWHRDLAALHFNVEPKHAYQILLGQDIEKLATGDDIEAFVALAGEPGFAEVFPDSVQQWVDQWARDGGDLLARLARNMSDERLTRHHFDETWLRIDEALVHLQECDTSEPEAYVDLANLIEHVPSSRVQATARRLTTWFTQHLPKVEDRDAESGRNWFSFIERLHRSVSVRLGESAGQEFVEATELPTGASFSLAVCGQAAANEGIDYDKFDGGDDRDTLKNAALELAKTAPEMLGQIEKVAPWFVDEDFWTGVSNRICDRLYAEKLEPSTRDQLVDLLTRIRAKNDKNNGSKTRIAQLANDGTLVWHTVRAHAESDLIAASRLIWLSLNATDGAFPSPNPGNHPHFGDLNADFQTYTPYVSELSEDGEEAKEIGRLVSLSGSFSVWAKLAASAPQTKVFASALKALVVNHALGSLLSKTVVQEFPELQRVLGDDLTKRFLQKFSDRVQHFPKHFAEKNSLGMPPAFLSTIARAGVAGYESVGGLVDAYLDAFTEQQWSDLFEARDQAAMEHLLTRIEDGDYRPTSPGYATALMNHTMRVLDGNLEVNAFKDRWSRLFDGLQPNLRSKFARDVLFNLAQVTTTTKSVEHFLEVCAPLANQLPFTANANATLDHIVIQLIPSPSKEAVQFLRDHGDDFAKCQKAATSDVRGRVEESLLSLRQSNSDGHTRATEIAALLNVRVSEPESD